ncbi:MAG: ribosome assembly RNA-binding protein YhbY [Firmicutes bacterium]|nr:ribosome assembly RNA-binding protein YhbY [Dethiobacter sp.]MBS3888988.1 ribosome assembly RNA-binding protein YhbY [Bacillota bacterium]MBS4055442.1 ribosome assembly RNA-binding protein YhbY [Thermaerobacter sp.]
MLSSKQRAYLRGLANPLDPIMHVGKGGLTEAVANAVSEALEARELIKLRLLKNNEADIKVLSLELATMIDAEVVQVIGRNFVLYRMNVEKPVIELPAH